MQENMVRNQSSKLNAECQGNPPQLYIEKHCWTKIHGWCKAANSEVSGFGLGEFIDNKFTVSEVFLPKQKCSSGYTDPDDLAVGKLRYRLHKKGINEAKLFRFWWHTHYNFNTFWSGTDDNSAKLLISEPYDWQVSLVVNQKGDWLCRMDQVKPFNITIDEIPVFLIPNSKKQKRKRNFKTDIKRWVRPITYEPPVYVNPRIDTGYEHMFSSESWWEHYQQEQNHGSEVEIVRDGQETTIFTPNTTQKEIAKTIEKQQDGGIRWGTKYISYMGKLMTMEKYHKIKNSEGCHCDHDKVTDWAECECIPSCDVCIDKLSRLPSEYVGRA